MSAGPARWQRSLLGIVALICALSSTPAGAAILGADNPKAYTYHDWHRDRMEFNLRSTLEQYKQVGHRDDKWDADAIKLLSGLSMRMAYGDAGPLYDRVDKPTDAELATLARRIVSSGCDDPVVLDMCGVSLLTVARDPKEREQGISLQHGAAHALPKSEYPPYRLAVSALRSRWTTDQQTDRAAWDRYDQTFWDAIVTAVAQPGLKGPDPRCILMLLEGEFVRLPRERQKQISQKLVDHNADPWIGNVIGGRYHILAAWDSRGDGWANSVTPDGWKGFFDHLGTARDLLTGAHRLHPEFPEAACEMITVAMGGAADPGETPRLWFDRAAAAQFDYYPAYTALLHAILPRWGGSQEAMYAFGVECAETGRYDTFVPYQFLTALDEIRRDEGGSWSFWSRPGVMDKTREVLGNYEQKIPAQAAYYRSMRVGIAWQVNDWDQGRKALDLLDASQQSYEPATLISVDVIPARTVSGTYALTGPHGQKLRQAERAAASGGDASAAADVYDAVGKQLVPGDDHAALFVRGRAMEFRWRAALAKGDWVDLTPGAELAGWYPLSGQWTSDAKGTLTATASDNGDAMIVCAVQPGTDYEFATTLSLKDARPGEAGIRAGPLFAVMGPSDYYWFDACPADRRTEMLAIRGGSGVSVGKFKHDKPLELDVNALGVHQHGLQVATTANDESILEMERSGLLEFADRPDNRLGLRVTGAKPGSVVRFSQLRVRVAPP